MQVGSPLPEKPGTVHIADLRAMSGNELLVAVATPGSARRQFNDWRDTADRIAAPAGLGAPRAAAATRAELPASA